MRGGLLSHPFKECYQVLPSGSAIGEIVTADALADDGIKHSQRTNWCEENVTTNGSLIKVLSARDHMEKDSVWKGWCR